MFTRRTAMLRLVQMVAGGSLGEAAGFLGLAATDTTWLRKGRIYTGAGHVHSHAKKQPDPLGFEAALNATGAEFDEPATLLTNYQQRRQALKNWSIDEDTWKALTARHPPIPGPQRPELGDRKRQIASIYVWVQVTSGEHHFAPRPIEAAQRPAPRDPASLETPPEHDLAPHPKRPSPTPLHRPQHEARPSPGTSAGTRSGTSSKATAPDPTTPASRPNSTPSQPRSPERSTPSRQQKLGAATYNWGSQLLDRKTSV